ncbi:hypothetical protein LMH87_007208 [Akanthomyces muscarius]|uniref:DUF7136 domain-containing protein n=1 Tax=Akanthomyces muscarius TaxID=2231603 RepID=A0A9W8UTJ6_AKAMU|nr:hypothetical protein LMH87_007208 [Akanthomyces muscarius]KAJ4165580.1 hypothetical protein LMH87_007208 [Akanthomyces muscarius]
MRFFPALLLACTTAIWPAAVLGKRNLPATVQVDLLFPRNETYKPAPWFPLVLAVKGLEDVWPFPMALDMSVISASSTLGVDAPSYRNFDMSFFKFIWTVDHSSSITHFVHIPLANITNGTTDQFHVSFQLKVLRRCAANGTEIQRNWGSNPSLLEKYSLDFSTSPDGKVPDIEESIRACPKPKPESSVALRISGIFTMPIYAPEVEHQDQWPRMYRILS